MTPSTPPHWIQIIDADLQRLQRRLEEAVALEQADREKHRQLAESLDTAERHLATARLALEQVRTLLIKHAGDDPQWRTGHEHTPLGQADFVAERALAVVSS
jgi:hypothetical protein